MPSDPVWPRFAIVVAAVFGFAGISLAAAASHLDDPRLFGNASLMCLVHAPVILTLALGHKLLRTAFPAALLLIIGTALFASDLLKRHYTGSGIFPMSAPIGGVTMMAGWLVAGLGALMRPRA